MDFPSTPQPEQIKKPTVEHSGDEIVREYNDTPLEVAPLTQFPSLREGEDNPVEIDFLTGDKTAEEAAGPTLVAPEATETATKANKTSRRPWIIGGTVLAGAAIAVGGFFSVKAMSDPQTIGSEDTDGTTTGEVIVDPPATDGDGTGEVVTPPVTDSLEIPAGLSETEYGEAFVETVITDWSMDGATQENEMEWVKAGDDSSAYLDTLVKANADKYTAALLAPNWQEDPILVEFVQRKTDDNKLNLELFFKTDLLGQTPFDYSATANSTTVEVQASGEKVYTTLATEFNNASENKAGELWPNLLNIDNNNFTFTYTTQIVDGVEKVATLESK